MGPDKQLTDALYREQVRRARAMTPEARLLEGVRLFDRVCQVMADGIRHEFPQADERQVREILLQRLRLARRLVAVRGSRATSVQARWLSSTPFPARK
jgi:hypothetical protein